MRAKSYLIAIMIAALSLASWVLAGRLAAFDDPRPLAGLITLPVPFPVTGRLEEQADGGQPTSRNKPLESGPGSFRWDPLWTPESIDTL